MYGNSLQCSRPGKVAEVGWLSRCAIPTTMNDRTMLGDTVPHGARPFIAAVVRQLVRSTPIDGRAAQRRVSDVLQIAGKPAGGGATAAEERLAADPLLLSIFFQNIDLLYKGEYRYADEVSGAILQAIAILDERER